jgi:Fe-S cluster assembly protein SufD
MTAALDRMLLECAPRRADGLVPLREAAAAQVRRLGLPTSKNEDWKYTPLGSLAASNFVRPSPVVDLESAGHWGETIGPRLVFVDGRFSRTLSDDLPDGVTMRPLAEAMIDPRFLIERRFGQLATWNGRVFNALNTALFEDGAFLQIAEGARPPSPIVLAFLTTEAPMPTAIHPRILVLAGARSEVTFVEIFDGAESVPAFTNAVGEMWLDERAQVRRIKVQREGHLAFHVATLEARLSADSHLQCDGAWLGGALSHDEIGVTFAGPGASCDLRGLFMGSGTQHQDQLTRVDHAVERCHSHELYKGVADDAARGVFSGRVVVRAGAAGTDAHQSSRNLLLSDRASIDARPQLAIYTDDVKCTHGAAVGQLDDDALFYLRSRGITKSCAKAMLVEAFVADMIDPLPPEVVRLIEPWVRQKISALREANA